MQNHSCPRVFTCDPIPMNLLRPMRILLFSMLILAWGATLAQQTILSGSAPGAERKGITVTIYDDLISMREIPLAEGQVDPTGSFRFELDIKEVTRIILAIDFHKAEMFLEPGKTYAISIDPIYYEDYTEVNPFIQSQNLTIRFPEEGKTELNIAIGRFNSLFSGFLMANFNALYRDRNRAVLDTFRLSLNREFDGYTHPYFLDYVRYNLASLEQLTRYYSPARIGYLYFTSGPVLYNNLEYMEFFNNHFTKYLTATSEELRRLDYHALMKSQDPYQSVMKALAADSLLKPLQLRELVLLKGLSEMFNSAEFNQEDILKLFRQIATKSKYERNKVVAVNLEYMLTRLKPGTPAPAFSLMNRTQQTSSLSDYLGKPVVLNFWTTYCEGCLFEMDLIRPMYDKYREQVHFVSISADKYFSKMLYFVNLKPDFVWEFLNTGEHSDVLRDYDVRSYPLFVLIDKEGRIVKYPAELPSSGLEIELQKLLIR